MVVVVVFSIANRHAIDINLWPLDRIESLPLFAVVLAVLIGGFLLGAIVMWLSAGRWRDTARRSRYQKEDLERELAYLRRQQSKQSHATDLAPAQRSLPAA